MVLEIEFETELETEFVTELAIGAGDEGRKRWGGHEVGIVTGKQIGRASCRERVFRAV